MDKLFKIIAQIWDWVEVVWLEAKRIWYQTSVLFFTLLVGIGVVIWEFVRTIIRLINWVLLIVQSIDIPSFDFSRPTGANKILSIANTFFPLDELIQYTVVYLLFYLSLAFYRKVKGWIPTMSGD